MRQRENKKDRVIQSLDRALAFFFVFSLFQRDNGEIEVFNSRTKFWIDLVLAS